jgi:AcrR family transcriptional regulator
MSATKKGKKTSFDIMQAAIKCVATIGIENTSLAEIAKIANVPRSLVAYYFPKKEELFLKITEHIVDCLTQHIEKIPEKPSNFFQIQQHLDNYFSVNHDYLVNFVNLLYYCNLRYRYYGHLREFYSYLHSFESSSAEMFLKEMDVYVGKLVRTCMQKTHSLPMLHSQVHPVFKVA